MPNQRALKEKAVKHFLETCEAKKNVPENELDGRLRNKLFGLQNRVLIPRDNFGDFMKSGVLKSIEFR